MLTVGEKEEGDFAFLQGSLGLLVAHGFRAATNTGVDKLPRLETLIGAPPPQTATAPKKWEE